MVTKKKTRFFKSLRFRIFIILIILGIVPGIIVTQLMIYYYENQAVEVQRRVQYAQNARFSATRSSRKIISMTPAPRLSTASWSYCLMSMVEGSLLVDRDFKIVKDTYHVDEGRTLVSLKGDTVFQKRRVQMNIGR